jgi:hypothetical protein
MGVGRGEAEGVGEFAVLLLACISRKAATDMRCEESDAMLSPRGLGRAAGIAGGIGGGDGDSERSMVGSARTCRNALRLKEESISSREGGGGALDFLRSRAQEKMPPDFVAGIGGATAVLALSCESDLARSAVGREGVEREPSSPYSLKRADLDGGGCMESMAASERVVEYRVGRGGVK